jgi:hypothetical protein
MAIRVFRLLAVLSFAGLLHPDAAAAHDGPEASSNVSPKYPSAIVLPAMPGPKPWSDQPLLNDPDRFQIAIMTDHTGGHRPGIWMKAVERLNWLRPTFVMSIGDLIEGDADDVAGIEAEWSEFLGFIDKMEMKFFFVAGNHDVKNPLMHDIWRQHFGAEWYSFDYKGVHFVCLSSEDTTNQIGAEQLAWLDADLKSHASARWTMLFLHKPLWVVSERAVAAGNPDTTNWKQVEALLGNRPHTVFAGHVHHYVQYDRNGMKYYHLATTGGSSPLRGVQYGEFDHITWLTMEPEGPSIANLLLDGIVASDAVTEKGITRFRDFMAKTRIEVAPILVDDDEGVSEGRIDVRLKNDFDVPVLVHAVIDGLPLRGLTVDPAALTLQANPGETKELSVSIRFGEKIHFPHLAETLLTATLRALDPERPLSAERTIPVVIDHRYHCPSRTVPVVLDGALNDWTDLSLTTGLQPMLTGQRDSWKGASDGAVKFAAAHDSTHIYLAASVTDDRTMPGDQLQFKIDGRWIADRRADSRLRKGTYSLSVPAPADSTTAMRTESALTGDPKLPAADVVTVRTATGWNVEAAIPVELVVLNQSTDWHGFQMTPVYSDVDDSNEPPVDIIWRGTEEVHQKNTGYGQFVRIR